LTVASTRARCSSDDAAGTTTSCGRFKSSIPRFPKSANIRGVNTETAARPRPLRLTQARIGDTLHDGNGTQVAIINAFTTVKPETDATVRAVDYQVVGAAPDQFRVYLDDERDVACWRRVEMPESP